MKYIFSLLFLISIFLPTSFANSALIVPGNVPTSTPLQPMPEGAGVNYTGNIEDTSENQPIEVLPQQENLEEAKDVSQQALEESAFSVGGLSNTTKTILALALVIFGGMVVFRAHRKNETK